MACWDIIGKVVDKPVYDLLGGMVNERLRSYTYLYPAADQDPAHFYQDPVASADSAALAVKDGFTAVKFDPAGQYTVFDGRMPDLDALERSATFCRLIRDAVGNKADLLFGTHGQFTAAGAIRMARQLEPYDPLWFEEPTPPDMPEEMAKVAAGTSIPVATGERLCSKFEFARILQSGAAAILQPNLGRVGGILEAKKIAAMAEAHYVQIAPHLYCGPVVAAANIQLAACSPNFLILESIKKMDGFHADLLVTPLTWEDGYVIPPKTPGLGVELNEDVARAHPYEGDALHLEMGANPYDPVRDRLFPGG
jgi:L-alanine-DL-glutamate epimerase-like enolase superfamily enzyme